MVTLPPMTAEAWASWRAESIRGYAHDNVRIGAWPADGAEARATTLFAAIVPDGQATPGHEFRSIVNQDGDVVGTLWFGPPLGSSRLAICIWEIVVAPEFRGMGYGRAALEALEPITRELGYAEIELQVFADNEIARNLYRSAGYVDTNVSMVKRLA